MMPQKLNKWAGWFREKLKAEEGDPRVAVFCDNGRHRSLTLCRFLVWLAKKHGYSPQNWMLGRERRIPGDMWSEEDGGPPLAAWDLITHDKMYADKYQAMANARQAFEAYRARSSIAKALSHRSWPTRGPFAAGDTVWYWRRFKKAKAGSGLYGAASKDGAWTGRAIVCGT